MAEQNQIIYNVRINTQNGKIAIDGLTKGFVKAEVAAKKLLITTNDLNTGLDKNINKTGLAGATVTELGRTISDSNYGIQGMANNLSQLSTLMATLISTTGGVVNGLKAMGAALMGPLGVIIIVQTLLALWEGYDIAQRKATKALYESEEASAKAASNLRILKDVINDENLALEEKQRAVKKANEEYEGLNIQLDKFGKLTLDSAAAIDVKIESMAREAKARAILSQVEREYAIQAVASAKEAVDFLGTWNSIKATVIGIASASKTIKGLEEVYGLQEQKKVIKTSEDTVKKLLEMMKAENLVDEVFKADTEKGRKTAQKIFAQIFLDLTKTEEKYRQESLKADLATEEEKIEISKLNALKELEITYNTYIEKRKLKLKEFLELNVSDKAKLDAQQKYNQEVIRADEQVAAVKIALNFKVETDYKLLARKRAEIARGEAETIIEIERQIQRVKTQRGIADIEADIALQIKLAEVAKNGTESQAKHLLKLAQFKEELRIKEIDDSIAIAEFAGQQLKVTTDFIDTEFQRQLDLEQNKTTAINNELNERLLNENLSKDERKRIQDEIARNDEVLRIKQEKIEKKRFYMQKAANIATAIINTYVAANGALKDTPGGPISRGLAAAAVIVSGLLNVAAIARQQFVSSAASAGTAGRGGSVGSNQVQSPEFNIVGQSASNQIAAAVQGQFSQPIRAYVVSKEMSTAQEMDRNIIGASSLG